jgi:hypothetical protein
MKMDIKTMARDALATLTLVQAYRSVCESVRVCVKEEMPSSFSRQIQRPALSGQPSPRL